MNDPQPSDAKVGYWQDWQDALAENARLCGELAALKAAPSAEEVKRWERRAGSCTLAAYLAAPAANRHTVDPHHTLLVERVEFEQAVALMRRARAAPAPSGVVVPEDVRAWCLCMLDQEDVDGNCRRATTPQHVAQWILCLPASPPPAAPDEELQRLLDEAQRSKPWLSPNEHRIFAVVEALARRAGAR